MKGSAFQQELITSYLQRNPHKHTFIFLSDVLLFFFILKVVYAEVKCQRIKRVKSPTMHPFTRPLFISIDPGP